MNFFDKLKAQVNPFDGGKTFSNPQGNQRQALPMRAMAQAMAQPMQSAKLQVAQPQPYGQQSIGRVQTFGGMQPNMQPQFEDEYTPAAALENTGYFNPQTTVYGHLQQGSYGDNQQGTSVGDIQRIRKLLGY